MSGTYDHLIKLLILGDSAVGKTCLLLRYTDNNFTSNHLATIGIDFKLKNIEFKDKRLKLQIWDTAGQERFRTITRTYYKDAMGVILAYDCTNQRSFDNTREWVQQIKLHSKDQVAMVLIGNKSDCPDKKVSAEQGQQLAEELGVGFFETSAKERINVDETFAYVLERILSSGMLAAPGSHLNLLATRSGKKSQSCCK